jgi:hypothetical protein
MGLWNVLLMLRIYGHRISWTERLNNSQEIFSSLSKKIGQQAFYYKEPTIT